MLNMSTINSAHISRKTNARVQSSTERANRIKSGAAKTARNVKKVLACISAEQKGIAQVADESGFERDFIRRAINSLIEQELVIKWTGTGESGRIEAFVKLT